MKNMEHFKVYEMKSLFDNAICYSGFQIIMPIHYQIIDNKNTWYAIDTIIEGEMICY